MHRAFVGGAASGSLSAHHHPSSGHDVCPQSHRQLGLHNRRRTRAQTAQREYSLSEIVESRKSMLSRMEAAAKQEDYAEAARLKREIEALNAADPVLRAKTMLESAIKEERYQDANKLKLQLKALETELGVAALHSGLVSTSSDTVTRGVRVRVQSAYMPQQSMPSSDQFMFAYHITITNESKDVVQLRHRHWVIMDGNGKKEEVRGPGVVGEQPIIVPGKSYEYTSGCPLRTAQGSMEGEYTMVVLSEQDGEWKETIEVKIGKFKLDSSEQGPVAL